MDSSYKGHRSRILNRFDNSGINGMHDYEILELLLTFTIKRKDTKPIAKNLIKRFNSLNSVFNASKEELARIDGIGTKNISHLLLIKEIISHCLKQRYENRSIISSRKDVESFLRFGFGGLKDEYIALLLLDNGNNIIKTEVIGEGTVNQCVIYPRNIIKKAIQSGAASIIIAHNHPGGSVEPSEADWNITNKLYHASKLLDISLLDHIIISANNTVSLRNMARWPDK